MGVFSECLKVVNWKPFQDYCTRDVCASPNTNDAFCNIISGLAYKCLLVGVQIDWMKDRGLSSTCHGVTGYGCLPGNTQTYSDCSSKVTRCRDMQYSNPVPDSDDCIPGFSCLDEKLIDDRGQCVRLADCTCYDRYTDTIYKAGEKSRQFKSECVCKNGDWLCPNGTADIRCPLNQVYRRNITTCGYTCSTYDFRQQCPKDTPKFDGCGCLPGTVMLTNGTCVNPDQCPCSFDGQFYDPSEKVSIGCIEYVCSIRQWKVLSELNCKKRCLTFGDNHYVTFDHFKYSFQGQCEYTLVKYGKLFEITSANVPCGSIGTTCTKVVKVMVKGSEVKLKGHMNTTINGVQVTKAPQLKFKGGVLVHTDLYTVVLLDLGMDVYWDGGTSITIALSTAYSGQVGGLCGNFDGVYLNEFVDLTSGQPSGTIGEFTSRWKIGENCPDNDVHLNIDPCLTNTKRKDWALESCAIIREGALFASCRKLVDSAEEYYQRCLFDSCGCDEGGDCKCLCAIVAAFARECALNGECVQWRSHDLCPDMCENGKVYQACAEPCKKTCSNFASNLEPCCKHADHVEGCFCPRDFVENENGVCVPVSECPCAYRKGPGTAVEMFPAGTTIDVNCQKCTCFNATFVCEGNLCQPCSEDQFSCSSNDKCIRKTELCDGIVDCGDRSDEYPENPDCGPPTCSPKQFTCASDKMCVPKWSICDGHIDCQDGSDEHNCEPICEPGFFRCDNYRCIPSTFICDGKYDCGPHDKSDEKHCSTTAVPCLHVDYYRCLNEKCIPRHMTCDGHDDCGDESDELDCYDCDGKLKVVDKLSPELKVDPQQLKSIFQSPNHTVPVKVMPATVIKIQILVPNSNIVSLHMFVDYIKEIQLVFLDVNGNPIKDGTHKWASKLNPGSDIAVMSSEKKYTSNMVKVHVKPFKGPGFYRRMLIKAITLRICYQLVPHVCPLDYKSFEYRYPDYGFGEFKTTINDVRDGSAILEGSMSSVTLSINDFVAITRSDPSDTFILMSMRLFAENITTLAVTFIDVNKTTIGEGVYVSTDEIVYNANIVAQKELLRLSFSFKTSGTEILAARLLIKACIKEETSTTIKTWTEFTKSTLGTTLYSETAPTTLPTSHSEIGSTTLPTSHSEIGSTTLPTSHSEIGSTTLPTSHSEIGSTTLPTSHSEIGSTTLPTRHSEIGSATLPTSHSEIGSTTLPTSHSEIGSTTLPTSHSEIGSTTLPTSHSEIGSTTLPTSHSEIGSTTLPTSHSEIGSTTLPTSHSEIGSTTLPTSHSEIGSTTLPTSHSEIGSATLPTSHSDIESTMLPTSHSEIGSTKLPTSHSEIKYGLTSTQPCKKNLPIDYTTYEKSYFEITATSDEGTYPTISQALRYSDDNAWTTMAREDQLVTMSFILKEQCPGNWGIDAIGFSTTSVKEVELHIDGIMKNSWEVDDHLQLNKVEAAYEYPLIGREFKLLFKSTSGQLSIANLYMNLICVCTLEGGKVQSAVYESSTVSTHSMSETTTSKMPMHSTPEYCPNAFTVDYHQPSLNLAIDLTDYSGVVLMTARDALLYGPGLSVPQEIGQFFSLVVKILEPCSTTWYFRHFQFGIDMASGFSVRIGSETITTSRGLMPERKYFTEKEGYFPGSDFELVVSLYKGHVFIYDLKLVACCDDLTTGITQEVTTGTVEWTPKSGHYTTETVTTMPKPTLHTTERVTGKYTLSKITSSLTEGATTIKPSVTTLSTRETDCRLKPMSIRKLLVGLKVTCLLKEDFNITVCDGDCGSRLVATIDFDYRRMVSPGTCSCCEGDGEVTTVIVKCFDVRQKDAYLGEHSITYMDYNRCFCTTCGLHPMEGKR